MNKKMLGELMVKGAERAMQMSGDLPGFDRVAACSPVGAAVIGVSGDLEVARRIVQNATGSPSPKKAIYSLLGGHDEVLDLATQLHAEGVSAKEAGLLIAEGHL